MVPAAEQRGRVPVCSTGSGAGSRADRVLPSPPCDLPTRLVALRKHPPLPACSLPGWATLRLPGTRGGGRQERKSEEQVQRRPLC